MGEAGVEGIAAGRRQHMDLRPGATCDCTELDLVPLLYLRRAFPHLIAHVHRYQAVENRIEPGADTYAKCLDHVRRDWKVAVSEWIRASGELWRLGMVIPDPHEGINRQHTLNPFSSNPRGSAIINVPPNLMPDVNSDRIIFDTRNTGLFCVPRYIMQWIGGADEITAVRVLSQRRLDTDQPDWSTLPDGVKIEIMFHVRVCPPPHREEDSLKRQFMQEESIEPKRAKTDPAIRACIENEGRTS